MERALAAFPARVARLRTTGQGAAHDSGIAGTRLDYPFGLPMARWLASRFPADVEVAWRRFEDTERLEELLPLLVTYQESEAFSEGGLHPRQWLALAKGHRGLSDLRTLLELFERAPVPLAAPRHAFEGLALPIQWRLRRNGAVPHAEPSCQAVRASHALGRGTATGLRRGGVDVRPRDHSAAFPSAPGRAGAEACFLIDMARASMATRARRAVRFSHPTPTTCSWPTPAADCRKWR